MWVTIAWQIVVALLPTILGISRGMMDEAAKAVQEAETTGIPAGEKREFVMGKLVNYAGEQKEVPARIFNVLLELAVSQIKGSTKA